MYRLSICRVCDSHGRVTSGVESVISPRYVCLMLVIGSCNMKLSRDTSGLCNPSLLTKLSCRFATITNCRDNYKLQQLQLLLFLNIYILKKIYLWDIISDVIYWGLQKSRSVSSISRDSCYLIKHAWTVGLDN